MTDSTSTGNQAEGVDRFSASTTVAAPNPANPFTKRLCGFLLIAILGVAADLATKSWIFARLGMPSQVTPPIVIVPGVFSLTTSLNEGALFGMGQQMTPLFAGLSVLALLGLFYAVLRHRILQDGWMTLALGLVTGGILGNLYDRLGLPALKWNYPADRVGEPVFAVRDWLHFKIEGWIDWPVFNIADSLLVVGAAVIIIHGMLAPMPVGGTAPAVPQPAAPPSPPTR